MRRRFLTKRTMLPLINSIYDPVIFAARYVLKGISLCHQNLPWDMEVNDDVKRKWNKFITKLKHVDELYVRRCIRSDDIWNNSDVSIHHFLMYQSSAMGSTTLSRLWMKKGEFIVFCYWKVKSSPQKVCFNSKVRACCGCFISKNDMFVEEKIKSW